MATAGTTAPRGAAQRPEPARLARGVLTNFDISAATLANIAPAMSFFFGFALIVADGGRRRAADGDRAGDRDRAAGQYAGPVLALATTRPARSSRSSAGRSAAIRPWWRQWCWGAGYIVAVSSVVCISGGWTETIINKYLSIDIPWQILTLVLTLGALYLIVGGAKPSTKVAALFFGFELVLLLAVAVALLIEHSGRISLKPFDPGNLHRGFSGLSLGFPLAVYLFTGWENSAAMAEETQDPRHAAPRAVFSSIALIAVLSVFLSYSTVVGFNNDAETLMSASVPIVDAAQGVSGFLAFLAYIAGFTSICSSLIAATNSQARIIFNSGREGLLPSVTGRVTSRSHTPWVAFVVFLGLARGASTRSAGATTRMPPSCSLARSPRSARSWSRSPIWRPTSPCRCIGASSIPIGSPRSPT